MTGRETLLLVHAFATLAMTGLIWFVQVVHYPLFRRVGADVSAAFAAEHQWRTSLVVVPLMLAEAATATLLLLAAGSGRERSLLWAGLLLLALIWISTALVQVPLHRRLAAGIDLESARRLVASNWIRTLGWTGRSVIALALLRGS